MPPKDLVILIADKNMEFAVRGLLSRHQSLAIRPIVYDAFVHPEKDPGCFLRAHEFLRSFSKTHRRGLVMFDREGCGKDDAREDLERAVEQRLSASGWDSRAVAIVIDPELEIWVWANSTHVPKVLGWHDHDPSLQDWLKAAGLLVGDAPKPIRPKFRVDEDHRPLHGHLRREGSGRKVLGTARLERARLRSCRARAGPQARAPLHRWDLGQHRALLHS